MSVLSLGTDAETLEGVKGERRCAMGVDTGKDLHVVILRFDEDEPARRHHGPPGVWQGLSDLDRLMKKSTSIGASSTV